MRGLKYWPSEQELERAYFKLQGLEPVSIQEFALYSQWARLDPRIAELWIARYTRDWKQILPYAFREELLKQPWPQSFGVLCDQAARYGGMSRNDRAILIAQTRAVLSKVPRAPGENYFVLLTPLGSITALMDAEAPDPSYSKWGYLGREVLPRRREGVNDRTRLNSDSRMEFLKNWLRTRKRVTVEEYRAAIQFRVSRRVAQMDLAGCRFLKPIGTTRGRSYAVKSGYFGPKPQVE